MNQDCTGTGGSESKKWSAAFPSSFDHIAQVFIENVVSLNLVTHSNASEIQPSLFF